MLFFLAVFFMLTVVFIVFIFKKPSLEHLTPEQRANVTMVIPMSGSRGTMVLRAVLMTLIFLWMAIEMSPTFLEFNKVIMNQDGSWVMKNSFNITLGTIAAETPRRIDTYNVTTHYVGASPRTITNNQIALITENKIYRSVEDDHETIASAADSLDKNISDQMLLADDLKGPEPYFLSHRNTFRYAVWGALGVILILSSIFRKKKTDEQGSAS